MAVDGKRNAKGHQHQSEAINQNADHHLRRRTFFNWETILFCAMKAEAFSPAQGSTQPSCSSTERESSMRQVLLGSTA